MSKQKKIIIAITIFLSILLSSCQALATSIIDGEIEISQSYLEYLELTDEEKEKTLAPRMYDIPQSKQTVTNPFRLSRMLGSLIQPKYSLKTTIPENMVIKNQLATGTCWAFASLASLESYFALQDYKNARTPVVYDFSEKHMDYATSRVFLNGEINEFGFDRNAGENGVDGMPISYLTNGLGAIAEDEMIFDGSTDLIDISEIKNKNVITQVNDIVTFPSYSVTDDKTQIKKQMKEHIMNYGAIRANINASFNAVGALYCSNSSIYPINHSVAIIGWDDEYPVENFNEGNRPENAGAWIAKNSYGPEVGDEGFIYISYEDANVYRYLIGILNAQTEITYENIYQYDELGGYLKYKKKNTNKIYLATEFDKKTEGKEYLTQVSIKTPETYTCKVYVNPNGTSKEMKDLQQVELKTGETVTFDAGYHTIEFANPIKIGEKFVVVLEIEGTQTDLIAILVEVNYGEFYTDPIYANASNHVYDTVTIADGKCFFASEDEVSNNQWTDASKVYEGTDGKVPNFDTTIKAFTTSKVLESIEIATPPTKTSYIEGQDFDVAGMVIKGNLANGDKIDITEYLIQDGTNLTLEQTGVTISYNGFTITQPIEVVKNTIESIVVTTAPKTIEYYAGESFDATDMIVEAIWKDGTTEIVTEYIVRDGQNLKNGQKTVTIEFEGQTTTQAITIKPNPVVKLEVVSNANKLNYIVGQNFNTEGLIIKATYESGMEKEITAVDYTIKDGVNLQENQTTVTIEFEGQMIIQAISVVAKAVTGISIKSMPSKTEYIQYEDKLELTGGVIKISYNDGTEEEMAMTSNEITASEFSSEKPGTKTIHLTYQGKTTQFDVEIKELAKAENSNFDNVKGNVKKIRTYYFTDTSKKEYTVINIELDNIASATQNDNMEYYYYLSSNPNEENITDWTKISQLNSSKNQLAFEISSLDVSNYEELVNVNTIYLYVKEVAIRNDMKAEKIVNTGSLKIENMNIEEYVDGKKKADVNSGTITDSTHGDKGDNTTASEKIPYAGNSMLILCLTFAIVVLCRLVYLKYKDIEIK